MRWGWWGEGLFKSRIWLASRCRSGLWPSPPQLWLSSVMVIDGLFGVGSDEPDGSTVEGLIFLVERQRDLITAVATGTPITPTLNEEYRVRQRKILEGFRRLKIGNPYPWPDLDTWWGYCAAPRFTKYRDVEPMSLRSRLQCSKNLSGARAR